MCGCADVLGEGLREGDGDLRRRVVGVEGGWNLKRWRCFVCLFDRWSRGGAEIGGPARHVM